MDLRTIRGRIDAIDREMLSLLAERMELALRTAKLKTTIRDPAREAWVLDQAARYSRIQGHLVEGDFVLSLFGEIIRESRRIQEKRRPLIGFQGEHGAFGELVARRHDPGGIPIPCVDFEDVFTGVENGWLDSGVVPVEGSAAGAVTAANDLVAERGLAVTGAVKLRLNHCLLAPPGVKFEDIRVVYSHPLALARCRDFLDRHDLEARSYYDTAGAARMLARERPGQAGSIGSELCAGLFGLEIIEDRIEDRASEPTRFLVLAREARAAPGDMCAVVLTETRGADVIAEAQAALSWVGIAPARIECLPCRQRLGRSLVILDVGDAVGRRSVDAALERLRQGTRTLRLLGFFSEEVCE